MADNPLSPALHGRYIPEKWSKLLLSILHPRLFLNYITNNKYEGDIRDCGDVVKIRTTPKITVRDYSPRNNLTVEEVNADAPVELAIDKGKYFAFNAEDIEVHQADVPYVQKALTEVGIGLKEAIESDVIVGVRTEAAAANMGTAAGVKSGSYNLGSYTTPLAITKDNALDFIINAGSVLDEQNAPENDRYIVIPPVFANRLKKSDIREVYITGDAKSSLRTGNIGMIDRFNVFVSNMFSPATVLSGGTSAVISGGTTYVPARISGGTVYVSDDATDLDARGGTATDISVAGATPTVVGGISTAAWYPFFGQKEAITFATQLCKNEVVPNQNRFGKIHRGLCVYGYEVIRPEVLGVGVITV